MFYVHSSSAWPHSNNKKKQLQQSQTTFINVILKYNVQLKLWGSDPD